MLDNLSEYPSPKGMEAVHDILNALRFDKKINSYKKDENHN